MDDTVEERLDAVERALTDGEASGGLPDAARMETRLDDLEATVAEFDDRLAELEAAVEALRGFAGGVRAVDEAVERRANAAVARVERLEAELHEMDRGATTVDAGRDGDDTADRRNEPGTAPDPATDRDADDGRDAPGSHPADGRSNPTDRGRPRDAASNGHADERTRSVGNARDAASNGYADRTGTLAETAAAAARRETERADVEGRPDAVTPGGDDERDGDATLADRLRRLL
jgi:hypothetical protein